MTRATDSNPVIRHTEEILKNNGIPIILVRHGQTQWNREHKFLGRTDIPLDDTGNTQATKLAQCLAGISLSAIWSSPLSRAHQTASILAQPHPQNVEVLDDLRELDQGLLEGLHHHQLATEYPHFLKEWMTHPGTAQIPGGETLEACQKRGIRALEYIAKHSLPQTAVLVVTHNMLLGSVLCAVERRPIQDYAKRTQSHTGVSLLSLEHNAFKLTTHNLTPHLKD